jgi:hypothetical protein
MVENVTIVHLRNKPGLIPTEAIGLRLTDLSSEVMDKFKSLLSTPLVVSG